MKSRWAQRPDQILAFENHLQPVKWGRIVQNGFFLQGACPLYAAIHFVRSVPILQVVNGVQMLKFDLGAAPTTFSPIPPGRKLRGTQRPPTFLKNPAFPPPVVSDLKEKHPDWISTPKARQTLLMTDILIV